MVEPAILKTVQRVKQRHVEEATHLPNDIDGEQADNHPLQNKINTLRPIETTGMNILKHFHQIKFYTSYH